STITSITSRVNPIPATSVNLEYARSKSADTDDSAYALDVLGNQDLLAYSLNYIHAQPDYPGTYRDMDFLTAGLTIPLRERLRFSANYRRDKRNLELDPSKSSANLERVYQAGMNYRFDQGLNLGLDLRTRYFEDRLSEPQFDYSETTSRISLSKGMNRLNIYSSAQIGTVRDRLDNTRTTTENYALSAYLSPFTNQTYSGYVYYDKNRPEEGGLQTCRTIGASSAFRLGDSTRLDLHYESRNYRNSSTGKQDLYEMHIAQTLLKNHQVSFQGRYIANRRSLQENESAFMIEYTIPFNLPVGKDDRYGTVKGTLDNVETNEPIANALVRLNGISTITDKKGAFTFNMVKPGDYFIDIDSGSIGLDKISAQKTPIKISVHGGEVSTQKLGVTRTAALTGRVVAYRLELDPATRPDNTAVNSLSFIMDPSGNRRIVAPGGEARLTEASGLPSIVVELRSGTESLCRITDRQGRFAFEELRPGTWTMVVEQANLPVNYAVAEKELSYVLAPGQTRDVVVRVTPLMRTVRIIEEKELAIEKPTAGGVKEKQAAPAGVPRPGGMTTGFILNGPNHSTAGVSGAPKTGNPAKHAQRFASPCVTAAKQEPGVSAGLQQPVRSATAGSAKGGSAFPMDKQEERSLDWLGLTTFIILFVLLMALICHKLFRSGRKR
ncbi:MAG TPA: hypothetical protein PLB81_09425, partial [Deltaproteobacteria bacterium]|nr:hypothetical protein [Deltaproteobacteria bacterium]